MAEKARITNGIAVASIGYGVSGLLAPSVLARFYGLADTAEARYLGRLFGSRDVALGALMLSAADEDRDGMLLLAAGINVLDTAAALIGLRHGMSKRSVAMASLSTAGFAAAAAFALLSE